MAVALILSFSCKSKVALNRFRLHLAQDSGYISSGDALRFLLDAAVIDTVGGKPWDDHVEYAYSFGDTLDNGKEKYYTYWPTSVPTDTIGKYYAFNTTGNYIVAFSLGRKVLLLELTPQSDIVNYDLLGHGSHACCWNSFDDMLNRYGPYFGVSTCGTGTAYCSSCIHLYKDGIDVSENAIPAYEYRGTMGLIPGHLLSSEMEFADSCLIMHYELEEFISILDEDDEWVRDENVSTRQFTVKYVYRNGRFETDEAYKLEEILM
jgi:hypothetical protein